MPEYYKLFFNNKEIIPTIFYRIYEVIHQLEFPKYTEILIRRKYNYSKILLKLDFTIYKIPNPIFIVDVDTRRFDNPILYSNREINLIKKYIFYNITHSLTTTK